MTNHVYLGQGEQSLFKTDAGKKQVGQIVINCPIPTKEFKLTVPVPLGTVITYDCGCLHQSLFEK